VLSDRAVLPKSQTLDIDVDLQDWQAHERTHSFLEQMILSRCLGSGDSTDIRLQSFRLVYRPHKEGDDTGMIPLASAIAPLLASSTVAFEISPESSFGFDIIQGKSTS
jgi:hypothetical protein